MKTYRPQKRTIFLWQTRIIIMSTALVTLVSWVRFLRHYFLIITVATFLLVLFLAFFYLPTYFKNYSLTVSDNALIIKSGIFIRHERIMPMPRLIYTERYCTPFSRFFGVSGLVLHATRVSTFTAELSDTNITEILKEMSQ